MKLSIIIVNYKTPALLKLCIKSILESSNLEPEIIVVDNESQEETQEMMREDFPYVSFVPVKENIGYAKAVNIGLKKSSGQYVFVLNPDIISFKGAIDRMVNFMESNPAVGMLGPQLINFNNTIQDSCYRFITPKIILYRRTFLGHLPFAKKTLAKFLMKDWDHQSTREVEWLLGAALMVRKEALDKVGLMDERFFLYFEDVDWSRRFWQNGYQVIYFPEAKMAHYHRRLSADRKGILGVLNPVTRIHIKSAIKYFFKYGLKNRKVAT